MFKETLERLEKVESWKQLEGFHQTQNQINKWDLHPPAFLDGFERCLYTEASQHHSAWTVGAFFTQFVIIKGENKFHFLFEGILSSTDILLLVLSLLLLLLSLF